MNTETEGINEGLTPDDTGMETSENCIYLNPGAFQGAKDGQTVKFTGEGIYKEGDGGSQIEVTMLNNQPVGTESSEGEHSNMEASDLASELDKLNT